MYLMAIVQFTVTNAKLLARDGAHLRHDSQIQKSSSGGGVWGWQVVHPSYADTASPYVHLAAVNPLDGHPLDSEQAVPYLHFAEVDSFLLHFQARACIFGGLVGCLLITFVYVHGRRVAERPSASDEVLTDVYTTAAKGSNKALPPPVPVPESQKRFHVDVSSCSGDSDVDSLVPRSISSASPPSSVPVSPNNPGRYPKGSDGEIGGGGFPAEISGGSPSSSKNVSPWSNIRTRRSPDCGELRSIKDEMAELTHELVVEQREAFKNRSCTRPAQASVVKPGQAVDGELRSLDDEMAALACDLVGPLPSGV